MEQELNVKNGSSIMKENIANLKEILRNSIDIPLEKRTLFFKTGPKSYGEHDQFMGIKVPTLRKIAQKFLNLSMTEIQTLIKSPINEERFLALIILIQSYQKGNPSIQEESYQFYINNLSHVNNWNLVDCSAHLIVGAHLLNKDKSILLKLSKSEVMWNRRVAIVATWYFIRNNLLEWTFKLAKTLLYDQEDLIHKATGWMLREAGKKNEHMLIKFLNQYKADMPRTMLRYSIEKFTQEERKDFLKL